MGLNWERLSMSGYFEALEAWNEQEGGDKPTTPYEPSDNLKRFMRAHSND